MAFDYTAAASTATRLLTEFGKAGQVHRFTRTHNPVTGTTTGSSLQTNQIVVAVVPLGKSSIPKALEDRLADDLAKGRVRKMLFNAQGASFEASVQDIVFALGKYWIVQGLVPLNVVGTPVLFTGIVTEARLAQADIDLIEGGGEGPGEYQMTDFSGEELTDFSGELLEVFQ